MSAVGDDCYFFCTATCTKGAACPFRHVETAKTCKIICQHWQTVGCYRPMCKFRHSDFPIKITYNEVPCYWESQPVGCSKPNCAYKHSKPRLPEQTEVDTSSPVSPKESVGKSEEVQDSINTFVMPTVKPVIIDPESEASNSSPVKTLSAKDKPEIKTAEVVKMAELSNADKKSNELIDTESQDVSPPKKLKKASAGKVVAAKKTKKKVGVAQKNGKQPAGKVKKVVASNRPVKTPTKRKKAENATEEKPTVTVKKKKVKERLGVKPAVTTSSKRKVDQDEESSDSDDSIENLKVLSMEEIFRQKALESMMKKRAAEGKPLLPEYNNKSVPQRRPASAVKSNVADRLHTKKAPVKKTVTAPPPRPRLPPRRTSPPPPPPQSDSEEEEAEDEEEKEEVMEEEEDSSSDSSSSSAESSEEETEVRRVVINLDAEKTAREKATASHLKKRVRSAPAPAAPKEVQKRKVLRAPSPVRVSVKDRLGKKPKSLSSSVLVKEDQRSVLSRVRLADSEDDEDEEEDASDANSDNSLTGVKVKSLGEIERERLRKFGEQKDQSPVKERLGIIPDNLGDEGEEDEDERGNRRILLTEAPEEAHKKKVKKRQWSSVAATRQKEKEVMPPPPADSVEEDERTVSATSPVDGGDNHRLLQDFGVPQSLFEALKRKALLKKSLMLLDNDLNDNEEVVGDECGDSSGKKKKHKHKHKRKHHKKSKGERQIYVPPAKKGSDSLVLEQKPLPLMSRLINSKSEEIPEYEEPEEEEVVVKREGCVSVPSGVAPRPRPRAAAMWSAGLSVSSKGERVPLRATLAADQRGQDRSLATRLKPALTTSKVSVPPTNPSGPSSTRCDGPFPVVKTFSQIMAEKRQKRLQEMKGGEYTDATSSDGYSSLNVSGSPSRVSAAREDSRPRVPITPIIFSTNNERKEEKPMRTKSSWNTNKLPKSTSVMSSSSSLPSSATSLPPSRRVPPSSSVTSSAVAGKQAAPIANVIPSYKAARVKKMMKTKSATDCDPVSPPPQPAVDTAIHIPSDKAAGDAAMKSPTEGRKPRRPSAASEAHPKHSVSLLDDEFAFFDEGVDLDLMGDIEGRDAEPIDDLLQDIDDLLA